MCIGSWHNYTQAKCLLGKYYYAALFMWTSSIARYYCCSLSGVICCCLSEISLSLLIFSCILSLHINGCLIPNFSSLSAHVNNLYLILDTLSITSIWQLSYIILLQMVNANDIHPNPGPIKSDNKYELCISHLNAQSLLSEVSRDPVPCNQKYLKVDEIFKQQVCDNKVDLITVSESWLSDTITDSEIALSDYSVYRKDRNRHGGGLLAYAHESLPIRRRQDLEINGIASMWLEIQLAKGKILVGTYYRPPGASETEKSLFMSSLQISVDLCLAENPKSLIILGDFNDRCKNFYGDHSRSELQHRLLNFVQANNLYQIITKPTRITPTSEYLLDLIITDSPGYILNSGVTSPICQVDHHGIFSKLTFRSPRINSFCRKIYNYRVADYIQLRETLSYTPWNTGRDTFDDINDSAKYFSDLFLEVIDSFIPNKVIQIRPKDKEWMTRQIHFLLNKRDCLYKRYTKFKSDHLLNLYKEAASAAKEAINLAKSNYFSRQIERLQNPETVSKEYHKLCKHFFLGKSQFGAPAILDNNKVYATPLDKATLFNNFFADNSTLPQPELGFALPPLLYKTNDRLSEVIFNPIKVYSVLKNLKVNKSNGPDNISNKMLKETAEVIAKPLSDLFNKSMLCGTFPDAWKRANVTPIHKKSDRQKKENYRPISLLSCVGKVMERIVFNELYEYCENHDLLTWRNAGFKKNESTVNQLLYLVNQIYNSLGNGSDVLIIFLDVSKAFDKVYHQGLLLKLESFGISDYLLSWLRNYLSGRQQRVVLNGQNSDWRPTNAGVPQGSILGPLLFLIFINDITDGLKCDPFLYADDTSLLKTLSADTDADITELHSDLDQIRNWALQWHVTFNATKTEYMILSKKPIRPPPLPIYFDGTLIERVDSHCHLGVWLSDNMTWEKHTQELIKKTSTSLNLLKRMSRSIGRKTKLCIYKTYIRPKMEYATSIFDGNLSNIQVDHLENLQRQALLCSVSAYRHTSHSKLLKEAGIEPLVVRRRYFGLCHLYKIIHGPAPQYLYQLLPAYVQQTTPYPLRNIHDFSIPRTSKNYVKLSFFWQYLLVWNSLDLNIRQAPSLSIFKNQIKSSTFSKPNKLYNYFTSTSSVHQSRMRMGLSGLNAHRKNYNFIDHDICPLCAQRPEDTVHFFLKCSSLDIFRNVMMGAISNILTANSLEYNQQAITRREHEEITTLLLCGSGLLPLDVNIEIFTVVHRFISDSKRFVVI